MKRILSAIALFMLLFSFQVNSKELVVVVNAKSAIDSLSKYEVVGIYMGRYRSTDTSLSVTPIDNEQVKEYFYASLIKKSLTSVNSYWARLKFTGRDYTRPVELNNTAQIIEKLLQDPRAIAYISKESVTPDLKIVYEL